MINWSKTEYMTPSIVTGIVNILFCPCLPKIASWFYKIKSPLFFKINVQWLLYSCVYPKWISYLFFFFQFRDSKWIVIFHFKKTNAKFNVDEHCLFANNCPSNRERYCLFIQWKTMCSRCWCNCKSSLLKCVIKK